MIQELVIMKSQKQSNLSLFLKTPIWIAKVTNYLFKIVKFQKCFLRGQMKTVKVKAQRD